MSIRQYTTPYYEFDADIMIPKTKGLLFKKFELKSVKARITVDALVNTLVSVSEKGVVPILHLPQKMTDEEVRAFKLLLMSRSTTTASLASLLSYSEAKARRILQGLTTRGLIKQERDGRQIQYIPAVYVPHPSSLQGISTLYELKNGEPPEEKFTPYVSVSDTEKLLKIIWDIKINDYRLIYYPYHVWKTYESGKEGIIVVDTITGNASDFAGKVLAKTFFFTDGVNEKHLLYNHTKSYPCTAN